MKQTPTNQNRKNIPYLAALLALTILTLTSATALSLSPGRTTLTFEPGLQKTVTINLENTEAVAQHLTLTAQGELKNHINLQTTTLTLGAGETQTVSYTVKLPSTLPPGPHISTVNVKPETTQTSTSEAALGATIALSTQLVVNVPYPGKYLESKLVAIGPNDQNIVTFAIPAHSLGEHDITDAQATIDLYDGNRKLTTITTASKQVPSKEQIELVTTWHADVLPGNYKAVATLTYDGQTQTHETTFPIGNKKLELLEIRSGTFRLGDIAALELLVQNEWSETIKDAHAEIAINNADGREVARFKTPNTNIPSQQKRLLTAYWDTKGITPGTYTAQSILKYAGTQTITDLTFEVSENKLQIRGVGYAISEGDGEAPNPIMTLLVVIVLLLIVLIIVIIFVLRRMSKSGKIGQQKSDKRPAPPH